MLGGVTVELSELLSYANIKISCFKSGLMYNLSDFVFRRYPQVIL